MRRLAIIIGIIAIAMIVLGLVQQIINNECKAIDKNTDFWVRNCDYEGSDK